MGNPVLSISDILDGAQGECTVKIGSQRWNLMNVKNLKAEFEKKKTEKKVLGSMTAVSKSTGLSYKGSATFYYVSSLFRELVCEYQETGKDFFFDITITNEDATSDTGRQTVTLINCNIDSGIIAQLDIDSDGLEEDMSFTFERFEIPEKFKVLNGMQL